MAKGTTMYQYQSRDQLDRRICAVICQNNGLKAREIARLLSLDRSTV